MVIRSISQVRVELSTLLAEIEKGCEVLITKGGRPVAKLVPFRDAGKQRVPGCMKGEIWIAPDFDVLPDEIGKAFGMEEPRGEPLARRRRTLTGVFPEDARAGLVR